MLVQQHIQPCAKHTCCAKHAHRQHAAIAQGECVGRPHSLCEGWTGEDEVHRAYAERDRQ